MNRLCVHADDSGPCRRCDLGWYSARPTAEQCSTCNPPTFPARPLVKQIIPDGFRPGQYRLDSKGTEGCSC